jgi:hypothetical protein
MAKPDRFVRLSEISLERHKVAIELDWRYPRLFDYLQVSPSYRLAHLVATGRIERNSRPLPEDFEDVERTYQAFGSVYRTYFGEWWFKVAQFRFGVSAVPMPHTFLRLRHMENGPSSPLEEMRAALERYTMIERPSEGLPAALLVAIPVSRDRRRVMREIAALIDREFGPEHDGEDAGLSAKLIDNKVRENTLHTAMTVLLARASVPKAKLYQVGNHTKISPDNWTDAASRRRDDPEVDVKRRMMEIVTARQLKRAYLFAENAARGRFPCLDPLPDDPARPEFEYRALGAQLRSYAEWGFKRVANLKAKRQQERQAQDVTERAKS